MLHGTPAAAEYLSGLPLGWTSPVVGAVDSSAIPSFFDNYVQGFKKLPTISLFTGVAGLDLGLHEIFRPVEYVESSAYCASVLPARMAEGCIPEGSIAPDITSYTPSSPAAKKAAALLGGFPCQGLSCAGGQKGLLCDARSALIEQVFRLWDCLDPKESWTELTDQQMFSILLRTWCFNLLAMESWKSSVGPCRLGMKHNNNDNNNNNITPGFSGWTHPSYGKWLGGPL